MVGMISGQEAGEIIVSMLAIALALSIANTIGGGGINQPIEFAYYFGLFLLVVGPAFVLHELGHRFVARKYGAYAVYKAWPAGLLLMLLMSVTGFIFAAPGAVYIFSPYITRKENGIISLAGPAVNLVLAGISGLAMLFLAPTNGILSTIANYSLFINVFLGGFNMLPIFPLDGSKVIAWNMEVWVAFFGIFLALFVWLRMF